MSEKTGISWCDSTWNPIRGCSKVSAGCKNCYAEKVAARFSGPGQPYEGTVRDGHWNGQIRLVPDMLAQPLKWKRARRIFVNSMSDLFHDDVPFEFIAAVFGVMAACPHHTFQVLTKRPARAVEFFRWAVEQDAATLGRVNFRRAFPEPMTPGRLECCMQALVHEARHHPRGDSGPLHRDRAADPAGPWPLPNVHIGVSVENQETADARIPLLLRCPAAVHFVSYEPALSVVDLAPYLRPNWDVFVGPCGCSEQRDPWTRCDSCIHTLRWLIVGGESGPNARPFDVAWARSTIEQCRAAGVACFVKQLGARPEFNGAMGFVSESWKLKDKAGADPSEWPADLRVQEFPEVAK